MIKKHIIISGTGRAGTTFLVQLFTSLGLDTGFVDNKSNVFANCNAGMEWDIRSPNAPYIVKSPWLCDYLNEVLPNKELIIEHAIIPVRDLFSAAESRRDVTARADFVEYPDEIPGGLWHTNRPEQQEQVLAAQLYKLLYTLAEHDISVTLLHFPRIVQDYEYLYRKLAFTLNGISFENFRTIFKTVAQPQLVHDFTPKATLFGNHDSDPFV